MGAVEAKDASERRYSHTDTMSDEMVIDADTVCCYRCGETDFAFVLWMPCCGSPVCARCIKTMQASRNGKSIMKCLVNKRIVHTKYLVNRDMLQRLNRYQCTLPRGANEETKLEIDEPVRGRSSDRKSIPITVTVRQLTNRLHNYGDVFEALEVVSLVGDDRNTLGPYVPKHDADEIVTSSQTTTKLTKMRDLRVGMKSGDVRTVELLREWMVAIAGLPSCVEIIQLLHAETFGIHWDSFLTTIQGFFSRENPLVPFLTAVPRMKK